MVPEKFIERLEDVVGSNDIIYGSRVIEVYSTDAGPYSGKAIAVVRPESAEEVSEILRLANHHSVPVVPRGAGSGTSGGAVPKNAVVIDMKKMDRIEVYQDDMIIFSEAGAILHDIKKSLDRFNLFIPPEPGSLRIATVGGFVANNGSGKRGFKYGSIRNFVAGINAVLPDGKIIRIPYRTHRSPGINHQVFVGSEGTLGVITGVYLRAIPVPEERKTYLIPLKDSGELEKTLRKILRTLPDAAEYIDSKSSSALGLGEEEFIAVEIFGDDRYAERVMDSFGGVHLEGDEERRFWERRETLGAEIAKKGARVYAGEDFAVPFSRLSDFIEKIKEVERRSKSEIFIYGHLDTCNLHPAIVSESFDGAIKAADMLADVALKMGATVGEHGVALRWEFLRGLEVHRRLKYCLDQKNILNPGKFGL